MAHEPGEKGAPVLSVAYESAEDGRRRPLLAGLPVFSVLPAFDDLAHLREVARRCSNCREPRRCEREFQLCEEDRFAILRVGREPEDEPRASCVSRSCLFVPGRPGTSSLGLEVICEDVDVARAHAEARALLAVLDEAA
ncbi:hypothetical protein [Streptomyces sp. NPDC006368]|uniref:hypothetical protein n=1 Tax=Streptomyces sp. NPDC006368 TaxID=3156760 RepID=UPI0033BEDD71